MSANAVSPTDPQPVGREAARTAHPQWRVPEMKYLIPINVMMTGDRPDA